MSNHVEMPQTVQIKIRVPTDVKDWLIQEARLNCSSQSSEIVRALRAQMATHGLKDGLDSSAGMQGSSA